MVTLVGVAHRGNIPLEDIHVDFGIEPVERPNGVGYGVREVVTLKGNLSDTERLRLERAARFCPVGQALNKGSVAVEDEVRWSSGEVTALSQSDGGTSGFSGLAGQLPPVPAGTVHVKYLLDTKEYDDHGEMEHEGETKVSMECGNLSRTSRWMILAGHSSAGWVPSPFPLAQAAWAASTATTLQRLLPAAGAGESHLTVEMAFPPGGQRGQAQRNAAEGIVAPRPALRRVTVPGTPRTTPVELVQAALLRDPISQIYRDGGVLLDEQVVVE